MTLEELKAAVQVGWTVRIIDYGYTNDGRDNVAVEKVTAEGLTLRPRQPWTSQGRRFSTMEFHWGGDVEVEGTTLHRYYTPTGTTSRTQARVRQLSKSFVFTAPKGY
jgi:hypothetical protein